MYEPERLNRWTRADNYAGATWEDYFGSGCGRHRDSDALERANFLTMLKALGLADSLNVKEDRIMGRDPFGAEVIARLIVRESHWAVGWVEWIAIHECDDEGLRIADECAARLEEYPILDEDLFGALEDDDCAATWSNCFDARERLQYLRDHASVEYWSGRGLFRMAREACRGDWWAAGQLLPCPSDLIY